MAHFTKTIFEMNLEIFSIDKLSYEIFSKTYSTRHIFLFYIFRKRICCDLHTKRRPTADVVSRMETASIGSHKNVCSIAASFKKIFYQRLTRRRLYKLFPENSQRIWWVTFLKSNVNIAENRSYEYIFRFTHKSYPKALYFEIINL